MKFKLKEIINNSDYSQNELKRKANVSKSHMSRIVNEDRDLSFNVCREIYLALGYKTPVSLYLDAYDLKTGITKILCTKNRYIDKYIFNYIKKYIANNYDDKNSITNFIKETEKYYNKLLINQNIEF